jgi:hypothetical protein
MKRDPDDAVARLREIERELDEAWERESTWRLHVGPVRVTRVMTSRSWFLVLVGVCVAAFGSGVVFTLTEDTKELGVALVVGSIFALSSFLGQVWTVQVQKEGRLRELLRARGRLVDELGDDADAAGTPRRGRTRMIPRL